MAKAAPTSFKFNRWDLFLTVSILGLTAVFCLVFALNTGAFNRQSSRVEVAMDGITFGVYGLEQNQVIEIPQLDKEALNILTIQGGKAKMTYASCPDQYCVRHQAIDNSSQVIVCLPNRVTVNISGGKEGDLDAIVN